MLVELVLPTIALALKLVHDQNAAEVGEVAVADVAAKAVLGVHFAAEHGEAGLAVGIARHILELGGAGVFHLRGNALLGLADVGGAGGAVGEVVSFNGCNCGAGRQAYSCQYRHGGQE